MVGHDFMDFRLNATNKGGADGCLNFNDPDNLGLLQCMQTFNLNTPYTSACTTVSLADFFIIAAEAVMGRTASDYDSSNRFKEGSLLGTYMRNL